MNICLIRPPILLQLASITVKPSPPLGLAYIAGTLRALGHKVTVIDAVAEAPEKVATFYQDIVMNGLSYKEICDRIPADCELIGLTIMFTCNWLSDKKLIDFIGEKHPKARIIAGGEHITGAPNSCIEQTKHLDVCVLGEGEETVTELVSAISGNTSLSEVQGIVYRHQHTPVVTERRARKRQLDAIPYPAWDLFPVENYQKYRLNYGVQTEAKSLPVMATRGCPYSCTFCSSPQMWGTRYYMRKPVEMVDELVYFNKSLGVTNFDFYDLTAVIRKEWIISFAQEIIHRGLKITWQIPAGTRSEAIDGEVAYYLYNSGCRFITYAPESGSPEILASIKKKVKLSRMLESMSYSYKEKMSIKLNMIIGFPEEKHKDAWLTIWFLIKASWYGVHDSIPAVFIPYVGSELFKRLEAKGEVDLQSDTYYLNMIYGDNLFGSYYYNRNMSKYTLRFYLIMYIIAFYGSNYLFRPHRFFKAIRNIATQRFETRGEMGLYEVFKRKTYTIVNAEEAAAV